MRSENGIEQNKMGFHRLERVMKWEGRSGREKHTTVDLIITRAPGLRTRSPP